MSKRRADLRRRALDEHARFARARAGYSATLDELRRPAAAAGDVDELLAWTWQADLDICHTRAERGLLLPAARRHGASNLQVREALGALAEGPERSRSCPTSSDQEREILAAAQQAYPEAPRPYARMLGRPGPATLG